MRKTMMEDLTKTTAELEEVCDRLDAGICRLEILQDRMGAALPLTPKFLDLAEVHEGLDEEIAGLDMLFGLVVNAQARVKNLHMSGEACLHGTIQD